MLIRCRLCLYEEDGTHRSLVSSRLIVCHLSGSGSRGQRRQEIIWFWTSRISIPSSEVSPGLNDTRKPLTCWSQVCPRPLRWFQGVKFGRSGAGAAVEHTRWLQLKHAGSFAAPELIRIQWNSEVGSSWVDGKQAKHMRVIRIRGGRARGCRTQILTWTVRSYRITHTVSIIQKKRTKQLWGKIKSTCLMIS